MFALSPLQDLARQCRLFAAMIEDRETAALLRLMAECYEQQSKEISGGGSPAFDWNTAQDDVPDPEGKLCRS